MFLLRFYNTLISKTAAIHKIEYYHYTYRECNVLVLLNRSHIFLHISHILLFYFTVTDQKTFGMKSKTKDVNPLFTFNIIPFTIIPFTINLM